MMCGKPAECEHHLLFGRGIRTLAEEDNLKISMCNACHNMAVKPADRIHENSMAENLSKMLGQAIYERDYCVRHGCDIETAEKAFLVRYGRNYL